MQPHTAWRRQALGKPAGGIGDGLWLPRNNAVTRHRPPLGFRPCTRGRSVCIKMHGDASALAFVDLVTRASLGSGVLLPDGVVTLRPGRW